MLNETYRIGELAKRAGVSTQTIRYYERQRLIPRPSRAASNFRVFPAEIVKHVRFIKQAQKLGFSLREIKELLDLRATPAARCSEVRAHAKAKSRDIGERIEKLKAMQRALTKLIKECSGSGTVTMCPILESLESDIRK